jgi:hypothetical protein
LSIKFPFEPSDFCHFRNRIGVGGFEKIFAHKRTNAFGNLKKLQDQALIFRTFPDAPRSIDLGILLYGDLITGEPDLIIPHPRMTECRFVLEPLAEVAPALPQAVKLSGCRRRPEIPRLPDICSAAFYRYCKDW